MVTKDILTIIQNNSHSNGGLIAILEAIQETYTYLPEGALRLIAQETGHSLTDIYGVATFYKAFSLKPKGKHSISACLGTACHVRGAQTVVEEFKRELNVTSGETTPDNEITFETVNCLGACALGPIVVCDSHYFANVHKREIREIIQKTKEGIKGSDGALKKYAFPLEVFCPQCGRSLLDNENYLNGYPSVRINASMGEKIGWTRLPSLYGNFAGTYEHEIPENTVVKLFCPHCGSGLQGKTQCMECNAPMAEMTVNGKDSVIRICTRVGCNGHMLDLNNNNRTRNY